MKVTEIYKKGDRAINEDAHVINEDAHIFAAIDGATGLDGMPGYLASHAVQEELKQVTQVSSLYESMQAANEKLSEKAVEYYETSFRKLKTPSINEIPKKQRSSTGVAAIQLDQDGLAFDYFHAGDCMLFLRYENNEIRTVTYDLVQYLDQVAINEVVKLREAGGNDLDLKDLREKVKPTLLRNRDKLNSADGYSIIDGSDKAFDYIEYGRIPLNRVTGILLLSDGLVLPTELDEINAWSKTAEIAFDDGLDGLLAEVEKREEDDPQCIQYPRMKQRDDKTGVLVEL
ncbi:protein phosphatase 2C domain-containing protein [Virgibacillus litoralis]|uniref:Serine/threonine protein phosphatase PrpC n=1 Tax=Virgibacillus litoralis TaxID=578221 RepID=A0ABS4HC53_9BACI|nr:protein phosphatase 2C domain-containing protein [Virgibacillus litoralis]MBP1948319.1 serine/threonine protein phosphatase PrpC [Virgibacillus litoralis]